MLLLVRVGESFLYLTKCRLSLSGETMKDRTKAIARHSLHKAIRRQDVEEVAAQVNDPPLPPYVSVADQIWQEQLADFAAVDAVNAVYDYDMGYRPLTKEEQVDESWSIYDEFLRAESSLYLIRCRLFF